MIVLYVYLIISYIISLLISINVIIKLINFNKKYVIKLISLLNIISVLNIGVIFPTFIIFSTVIIFPMGEINIFLLKILIFIGFLIMGLSFIIFFNEINYNNIDFLPLLIYSIIFGILFGTLMFTDSISYESSIKSTIIIFPNQNEIIDFSLSSYIKLQMLFFMCFIFLSYIYVLIKIYIIVKNQTICTNFLVNSFYFFIPNIIFISILFFGLTIMLYLYFLLLIFSFLGIYFYLKESPKSFLVLINKIYYINIYHRSGVLLYSYNFGTNDDETEEKIWGNILIGINYILSEFIDKQDQIDVLQTKNSEIVVRYSDKLGFAVIVITNLKNKILGNSVKNFTIEFEKRYKDELTEILDLNKIINVSKFEDTKEIIEKNFSIYLS